MTIRPPSHVKLPMLATRARIAIEQEAAGLTAALDEYAISAPKAGCPFESDTTAASRASLRVRRAQQELLTLTRRHARMMYVNAHDHLVSMGRLLGSDGAMSLFAHMTLSRSVCEAAVRHGWLLDPALSYEQRITRGAAVLIVNADNRLKGAKSSLAKLDSRVAKPLIAKCIAEHEEVGRLIDRAGIQLVRSEKGPRITHVELRAPVVRVPTKLDVGPLMADQLPDSPGWYSVSSGIAHSADWMLADAVVGGADGPQLELSPDLLELAAAAQTAISASALIIERHAVYYGFDPEPYVRRSRQRRGILDVLMRDQMVKQATDPAPMIAVKP